ncbi:MAG: 3-keto-5-aminohexanoate cleavage protein [Mycetocola sp.]
MGLDDNTVHWDRVREGCERTAGRMIWKPYGLPEIIDPSHSSFHDGEIQSRWDVSDKIVVQAAITGAFYTRNANPNQPLTVQEILEDARACARAGASAIHLHVRGDNGYNVLDPERFQAVVNPLRAEFEGIAVDGCYVTALEGEWEQMKRALDLAILDGVPVNTTAVFNGDALFAKPVPLMLEKTRLILEAGAAPIVAVYTDADVNNADRFLFRSGLLDAGQVWCVLPSIPGSSPMENPKQMIDGLQRFVDLIRAVDPEAKILVCAAGRASVFLATAAALLGLHVRVGMEDTVWKYPHRDTKLASNLEAFLQIKTIVEALGRQVATPAEYREIMGVKSLATAL